MISRVTKCSFLMCRQSDFVKCWHLFDLVFGVVVQGWSVRVDSFAFLDGSVDDCV